MQVRSSSSIVKCNVMGGGCSVMGGGCSKGVQDRSTRSPQHPIRLIAHEICPFTTSIRMALQFKGIVPEFVADTGTGAALPRLEHGRDVIAGSAHDILRYVEQEFKAPSLIPVGLCSRSEVFKWVAYVRDVFAPLVFRVWQDDDPSVSSSEHSGQLRKALQKLDSGLDVRGPFFVGKRLTMVDIYVVPLMALLGSLYGSHGAEVKASLTRLPNYMEKMLEFPCYAAVAFDSARGITVSSKGLEERMFRSPVVGYTVLQHRSILRHLGVLVSAASGVVKAPSQASLLRCRKQETITTKDQICGTTQMRQLARDYDRLLVVMQQHAQMEEQAIFAALENAKRGVTNSVLEEHARDLPIMNGVREDIKTVVTLEPGSPSHTEALNALSTKLRLLEDHTRKHFREEEKGILPLLDAAGLKTKQQQRIVDGCIGMMDASQLLLLPFFLSGLLPHEMHGYITLLHKSQNDLVLSNMIQILREDDEFRSVWDIVQQRVLLLASPE